MGVHKRLKEFVIKHVSPNAYLKDYKAILEEVAVGKAGTWSYCDFFSDHKETATQVRDTWDIR
ncbi:hypothetical protein [Segetibacter aerophilus]|uniref:Uncharacterized protein n=1 Tax=Segetibacter aerophilus TaxID=670293 RepID=A0A512BBI6_9BACT|nr:hypothetical protein [Segetibacter aerophilus]GEO09338.1 hypothetical protein SAE01_18340 [Segetibacter aerophilus]